MDLEKQGCHGVAYIYIQAYVNKKILAPCMEMYGNIMYAGKNIQCASSSYSQDLETEGCVFGA